MITNKINLFGLARVEDNIFTLHEPIRLQHFERGNENE